MRQVDPALAPVLREDRLDPLRIEIAAPAVDDSRLFGVGQGDCLLQNGDPGVGSFRGLLRTPDKANLRKLDHPKPVRGPLGGGSAARGLAGKLEFAPERAPGWIR